ncbi:carbohydrate porin [Leptolyngbya sp. FACHB-261]|nr:carbohydrate porin [Leptolyngbya sp. FACHB-261]
MATVCPVILGAVLLATSGANASEALSQASDRTSGSAESLQQVAQYSTEGRGNQSESGVADVAQLSSSNDSQEQVTSVSQLSDVRPTDWAFQALQSLVERYGVIAGYPDGTYRGNRALTRYEFAAGLNAALDRVNELIAAGLADKVSREDLATLQRLQEEFSAELATIRGRVDGLEARTAELEANQFSTTTKLTGEAIFAFSGFTGGSDNLVDGNGNDVEGDQTEDSNIIFTDRVRLNFDASFSGQDRLRIRLETGNTTNFSDDNLTGTNQARLAFDTDFDNEFRVSDLFYQFNAFGTYVDRRGREQPRARIAIGANDFEADNVLFVFDTLGGSGSGPISRFGRRNPLYRIGGAPDAGIGFDFNITPIINIGAYYGTAEPEEADPFEGGDGGGIFGGTSAVTAQLTVRPFSSLTIGLTYVNAFLENGSLGTGTGSILAEDIGNGEPTNLSGYGLGVTWDISPSITFQGFATYLDANVNLDDDREGSAQSFGYLGFIGFRDVLTTGSVLAFGFGQPLKLSGEVGTGRSSERDTTYHAEAFYRVRLTDNIAITPGVIYLFNPEHNSNNDDILIGTIRTTFTF